MQGDAAPEREDLHEDLEGAAHVLKRMLEGVPTRLRDADAIVVWIVNVDITPEEIGAREDNEATRV